jgi:DNA invertase Pin-like site-specific DNA recombinase
MLGVSAEFETNSPRERQLEGIDKAKYKGRPASIDVVRMREMRAQEWALLQSPRLLVYTAEDGRPVGRC